MFILMGKNHIYTAYLFEKKCVGSENFEGHDIWCTHGTLKELFPKEWAFLNNRPS
jgi:hypothetical protein